MSLIHSTNLPPHYPHSPMLLQRQTIPASLPFRPHPLCCLLLTLKDPHLLEIHIPNPPSVSAMTPSEARPNVTYAA